MHLSREGLQEGPGARLPHGNLPGLYPDGVCTAAGAWAQPDEGGWVAPGAAHIIPVRADRSQLLAPQDGLSRSHARGAAHSASCRPGEVTGGHGPFTVTGHVLAPGRLKTGQWAQPAEAFREPGDTQDPTPRGLTSIQDPLTCPLK